MSLLNTATSALLSYQKALATTGHNIANVNTEGYRKQRVDLTANEPELFGGSFIGRGVNISAINRSYDEFLYQQVLSRTASTSEYDTYLGVSSQLDATLADPNAGLGSSLQSFFNSVQDLASNPSSTPARQVVLSEGESLANRFHTINQQVKDLRDNVYGQLGVVVTTINHLSKSIADINFDIVRATGEAGGGAPNDLLDQRDRLVTELADLTTVKTSIQDDGAMNVFIGTGQALVLGNSSNTMALVTDNFDVSEKQLAFVTNGVTAVVTSQLTGGRIGGLLAVKDEVVDTAQNTLGRIALALTQHFNAQHQLGSDLNGNNGGLFFADIMTTAPAVLTDATNNPASGSIAVSITDVNALTSSDYRLNYDGSNFSLVRMDDNTLVDSGFTTADFPRTVVAEGLRLSLNGGFSAGDSFLIRPTRDAAGQFAMQITDTGDLAAAAAGKASGNNENALALAGLQSARGMANSSANYQETFGSLIADVGVKTNRAYVTGQAQQVLLKQAIDSEESVSGVNLDEEAANLLKYQQAYQANAKVISTVDAVFQSLLNAIG